MKSVASRDNPLVRHIAKLAGSGRAREDAGETILDGPHLVRAALDEGVLPRTLVVAESRRADAEIGTLLARVDTKSCILVPDALLKSLSPVAHPTGVLAVIAVPRARPPSGPRFAVLLEDIQDPGNVGSILRSAAAAGAVVAWLSAACADPWSPKVLRAGMGAQFALPVVHPADLAAVAGGFPGDLVVTVVDPSAEDVFRASLAPPLACIFGNEGAGVSPPLAALGTRRVRIPMAGPVESLGVAAAAAVTLFEIRRRVSS